MLPTSCINNPPRAQLSVLRSNTNHASVLVQNVGCPTGFNNGRSSGARRIDEQRTKPCPIYLKTEPRAVLVCSVGLEVARPVPGYPDASVTMEAFVADSLAKTQLRKNRFNPWVQRLAWNTSLVCSCLKQNDVKPRLARGNRGSASCRPGPNNQNVGVQRWKLGPCCLGNPRILSFAGVRPPAQFGFTPGQNRFRLRAREKESEILERESL